MLFHNDCLVSVLTNVGVVSSNSCVRSRCCVPVSHLNRCTQIAPQINSSSHLPHFFLGVVYTKQGRFPEAVTAYESSLFLDNAFFPSIHNLGSLQLLMGNNDLALHYFKAALDRLKANETLLAEVDAMEKDVRVRIFNVTPVVIVM